MPFPFRLKKKLDDDVSTASSRDSIPTLPPIARVNTDDFFSGSDSGHGEMSDAPRSTPAQSAAIESVASGQAPRRTKKRVKIPRSRKADEDQPGLIAELEAELVAVKAKLALEAGSKDRRHLEEEKRHVEIELENARKEAGKLLDRIRAYENEVRELKDREREQAPTRRILQAFLKLRSADEASDLERIYLKALNENPDVTTYGDSIYGPPTALHRGFNEMMRHQPAPEQDPRLAEYNAALQAACPPWYKYTRDSKYFLTRDPVEELAVRGRVQVLYKSWLATSRALAKAKSDLYHAQTRLDRLQGGPPPVVAASPFQPTDRASAPPIRSILKIARSREVPEGVNPRMFLRQADKRDVPHKDELLREAKSRTKLVR